MTIPPPCTFAWPGLTIIIGECRLKVVILTQQLVNHVGFNWAFTVVLLLSSLLIYKSICRRWNTRRTLEVKDLSSL